LPTSVAGARIAELRTDTSFSTIDDAGVVEL
jgi:hypothetical protein